MAEQNSHDNSPAAVLAGCRRNSRLSCASAGCAKSAARQSPLHGAEKTNRQHSERPSRSLRRAAEGVAGMSTS